MLWSWGGRSLEILKLIKFSGVSKAQGHNNFAIQTIKASNHLWVSALTNFMNLTIKSSNFPDCLNVATVTSLFNKRDVCDPNSYRPNSILPAQSKTEENVLYIQIWNYLNSNNIIAVYYFNMVLEKVKTWHLLSALCLKCFEKTLIKEVLRMEYF